MIEKVVSKGKLCRRSQIKDDLNYWLSKTPKERIAAVEHLRNQYYGSSARLQRAVRIVKRS